MRSLSSEHDIFLTKLANFTAFFSSCTKSWFYRLARFPTTVSRAFLSFHTHTATAPTTRFSRGCRRWNVNTPRPIGFMVIAAARSRERRGRNLLRRVPSMRARLHGQPFAELLRLSPREEPRGLLSQRTVASIMPIASVSQPNRSDALPALGYRCFDTQPCFFSIS